MTAQTLTIAGVGAASRRAGQARADDHEGELGGKEGNLAGADEGGLQGAEQPEGETPSGYSAG